MIAAETLVVYPLQQVAPEISLGVVDLLGVLLISSMWGLALGVGTAVLSTAAFDFFHVPGGTGDLARRRPAARVYCGAGSVAGELRPMSGDGRPVSGAGRPTLPRRWPVLTNVVKHARADRATVTVQAEGGALRVEIRDEGVGGADPARGSGLVGLRDRVEAPGGTIEVMSPRAAVPRCSSTSRSQDRTAPNLPKS